MNASDPADSATRSARERILLTAHDLFYRDGIRATGIDRVIAESGVTKTTFYRHFPSKNDLIRAFLEYRHRRWMDWFGAALLRHGATPGGGLAPLAPALAEWFQNPIFRGCAFINSVAELGGVLPDVADISRRHKDDMMRAILELLPESPDRQAVADAVAVAVDGAIVKAQLESSHGRTPQAALASLERIARALTAAAPSA
ncbi:TetR/AcrR family transcriptional regulator [Methylogaea oryzae]|uniref:TetR family transcriptional regulator n=2 Tax=Methylogaea oryzae TaxID=1295382 RepID=A0A8D4VSZ0_9GAMM|nr:TetR/AcrR family transcriptional regulator [Methylogaea oryzae]BBL72714.1 TetR family transcriptional regulator [Methylogaea oryzae]